MRKITTFILLLSVSLSFAQRQNTSKITLTGKIIESDSKQPLEYATMVLTHTKSKRVLGGITDGNGKFSIEVPKGLYDMKVEFIGFKTKKLPQKQLTKNTDLGTIPLSEDLETLDEVEIVAEKSTVEIKLDKKIYNVGKDMTIKGGNAADVLDNVPSVNVDSEGAVSLRGNENVRILINGKPSALVGLNGADALKNLPADAIEKVEVVTSPSARYDAEGTAGILNIILRKGKIKGFNGSTSLTIGNPDLAVIGGNLNYKTKKVNIFSNIGYSYRKSPGTAKFETRYINANKTITNYTKQDRDYTRKLNGFNGSLGLEYFLNDKNTITGTFRYQKSNGNTYVVNSSVFTDANLTPLSSYNRIIDENANNNTKQYSLNYTNNIDDNGQKLTADLQFSDSFEEENSQVFNNKIELGNNNEYTKSKNYLLQTDYTLPFKEKSQLELGYKIDAQNLQSNFIQLDKANNKTNQVLNFDQIIYAYYAQYGNKINNFSYLLGLRAETTKVDLKLVGKNGKTSKKDYTKLFPTVNFGYQLNDTDNLTIGYSRRLQRPRSWFLNPFRTQNSSTFVFQGNPDLNPAFTNSFDLGYNTKIKKLNLGSSIYYQHSISPISIISRTINNGTIEIRQPINLNAESRYGFEINTSYSPARWIRLSANFNYFNYKTAPYTFYYTENNIDKSIALTEVQSDSWFARFNSRITLPAKIQWQTRIMYRGAKKSAQTNRKGMFVANLAFSKDLLKEKASLVLNVSDLFNSRKRELTTYNEDRINPSSITDIIFQRRKRQISLSFTYRFNQKKKRGKKRNNYEERESGGF